MNVKLIKQSQETRDLGKVGFVGRIMLFRDGIVIWGGLTNAKPSWYILERVVGVASAGEGFMKMVGGFDFFGPVRTTNSVIVEASQDLSRHVLKVGRVESDQPEDLVNALNEFFIRYGEGSPEHTIHSTSQIDLIDEPITQYTNQFL